MAKRNDFFIKEMTQQYIYPPFSRSRPVSAFIKMRASSNLKESNNASTTLSSTSSNLSNTIYKWKKPEKTQPESTTQVKESVLHAEVVQAYDNTVDRLIEVELTTFSHKEKKKFKLSNQQTGYQLKTYIFEQICQDLEIQSMFLHHAGVKIENNHRLAEYRIVNGVTLTLEQSKVSLDQVSKILVNMDDVDPISYEKGTAKMCCGHSSGRDNMTLLIRSLIDRQMYEIKCPFKDQNDQDCLMEWDFDICKKIGIFSAQEREQFEEGLSKNWIKKNAKNCPNPKCAITIYKGGLTSNRVKCPACKYGDFCYFCLKKWTGNNKDFCGSEECSHLDQFLATVPWDKKFNLFENGIGKKGVEKGIKKQYKGPQIRACPNCRNIIQHNGGCKHMACTSCKKSFCWLCLTSPVNGVWACGQFSDYCKKIAQPQKIFTQLK